MVYEWLQHVLTPEGGRSVLNMLNVSCIHKFVNDLINALRETQGSPLMCRLVTTVFVSPYSLIMLMVCLFVHNLGWFWWCMMQRHPEPFMHTCMSLEQRKVMTKKMWLKLYLLYSKHAAFDSLITDVKKTCVNFTLHWILEETSIDLNLYFYDMFW